jgi:hypothetical protein
LLAILVVGALGAGGWYGYQFYSQGDQELAEKEKQLAFVRAELANRDELLAAKEQLVKEQQQTLQEQSEEIVELNEDIKLKEAEIERLDTSLRLLKVDRRVAWLTVLDQEEEPDTGELYTKVQFVEVDDQGKALDEPREFRIKGDVVYVDNWVVKFDDKYVEQADIERSTSLVLFRRIFGEAQTPNNGFDLDAVGTRPSVYGRGKPMSEFEKKIWDDFWNIANNVEKARSMGIRAAHGEAPSIKLQKGKSYKIQLRASDGLSITPDSGPPPVQGKPAA